MRRWFLSYHSPDQALAERLKAALERKDKKARVFFAPSRLRAGDFWSRAQVLARGRASCGATHHLTAALPRSTIGNVGSDRGR